MGRLPAEKMALAPRWTFLGDDVTTRVLAGKEVQGFVQFGGGIVRDGDKPLINPVCGTRPSEANTASAP
jgi:hypothetical protein